MSCLESCCFIQWVFPYSKIQMVHWQLQEGSLAMPGWTISWWQETLDIVMWTWSMAGPSQNPLHFLWVHHLSKQGLIPRGPRDQRTRGPGNSDPWHWATLSKEVKQTLVPCSPRVPGLLSQETHNFNSSGIKIPDPVWPEMIPSGVCLPRMSYNHPSFSFLQRHQLY